MIDGNPTNFIAHIAVLNSSTIASNSTAIWWSTVCAKQLREHLCPLWGIQTPVVSFAVDEAHVTPDAELIVLLDNSDTAGALGYHDVTPLGAPYSRVFLETGNGLVTLTHEGCEMVLDPLCDVFVADPKTGLEHALEACDACENDTYQIDGEQASDFLLPGFFGLPPRLATERSGAQLITFAGTIDKAFDTGHGGYQIVRDPGSGKTSEIYGRDRTALGKTKEHPASRTKTRLGGQPRTLRRNT